MLNPDGVTPRPCNTAGPFPGMVCASFLADATGGKTLNREEIPGTSGNQATPADAENHFNAAYQQAGGTGVSPCIGLQQAATYAANNNFVGKTSKQPTYLPFGEAPMQCLNPVMLKIFNTFVPAVVNSTGGLAVTQSPSPTGDKNLLVRSDYILNGQHSFDARYDLIDSNSFGPLGVNSSSVGVAPYASAFNSIFPTVEHWTPTMSASSRAS